MTAAKPEADLIRRQLRLISWEETWISVCVFNVNVTKLFLSLPFLRSRARMQPIASNKCICARVWFLHRFMHVCSRPGWLMWCLCACRKKKTKQKTLRNQSAEPHQAPCNIFPGWVSHSSRLGMNLSVASPPATDSSGSRRRPRSSGFWRWEILRRGLRTVRRTSD